MTKSEQYREAIPYTWKSINLQKFAMETVAAVKVGLDPLQPNHINLIPYANKTTQVYDIGMILGYKGLEIKAHKYGLDVPDSTTIELIYSTDKFRPIKKDARNAIESYEFEITNVFERGTVIGGFYYHSYNDNPSKNKLVILSVKDIEKRKPKTASVEFWGGEKDEWVNGKKTGKKVETEGWYEEMCYKTIARAAYNSITIDSTKIDSYLEVIEQNAFQFKQEEVKREIAENANQDEITIHIPEPESTPIAAQINIDVTPQSDEAPF
jgi:recombination protein RecT